MSSSSSAKKDGPPSCGDPYKVLGIEYDASDADISKAYRRLALKLHPDKQRNDISPSESEGLNRQFHDVKEARAFLLDPEYREARRKYDAKLESDRKRREEDERREQSMSSRRKILRDELLAKERREAQELRGKQTSTGGRRRMQHQQHNDDDDDDVLLERLRRETERMREQYGTRTAMETSKQKARDKHERVTALEHRQVRLKWKRSRASHSDHTVAKLLSRFGQVQQVELIGAKGNAALVTFANASSCRPCVEAYADSDVMRASYVGHRKQEEMRREFQSSTPTSSTATVKRDGENLEERKLRQAAEREHLLRQMEMEDANDPVAGAGAGAGAGAHGMGNEQGGSTFHAKQGKVDERSCRKSFGRFPPPFPPDSHDILPFNQLEKMEQLILEKLVSPETLTKLKIFP